MKRILLVLSMVVASAAVGYAAPPPPPPPATPVDNSWLQLATVGAVIGAGIWRFKK